MIPKIIHYCWFSDEPYPEHIKRCMESWKIHLADYEFIRWDLRMVSEIQNRFLKEALEEKKWAFAADFIRVYAVYTMGGIYLDSDVLVFRNFDDFRFDPCFIGRENSFHKSNSPFCVYLTSHAFGARQGNAFIKECLDYYDERPFVLSSSKRLWDDLRFDQKLLPYIQALIAKKYGYDWLYRSNVKTVHEDLIIYPSHFFDAVKIKSTSVCKHLALGSWRPARSKSQNIKLGYKIEWRLIKIVDNFLRQFSYMVNKF